MQAQACLNLRLALRHHPLKTKRLNPKAIWRLDRPTFRLILYDLRASHQEKVARLWRAGVANRLTDTGERKFKRKSASR